MKLLNKFTNWYLGNNDRETEPPRSGLPRVIYIIINYTGRIVAVNLVFILCCIPIITIPAAIMALNRYLMKMYRDGFAFDMSDYFKEYKNEILRGVPLGVIAFGIIFYGYYLLSLAGNYRGSALGAVLSVTGAVSMLAGGLFMEYAFVMGSVLDLNIRGIIKNAIIFMMIDWKADIKITTILFAFLFLCLNFLPFSLIFLFLFAFSFLQILVISVVNEMINRHILEKQA